MKHLSIILLAMLLFTTTAFGQETKQAEVKYHEEGHGHEGSKFNGAWPAIGVGVLVVGLTGTYLMSDNEEEELEFMLMLNESADWVNEHTVPDERGLSFKLMEW